MVKVLPFKAIRPTRDKVNLVASRSYLSYSEETIKEKIINNPYTFLHIINPEYNKSNKKKGIEKFKLVREKFNEFIKNEVLIEDIKDAFYIYQQTSEKYNFIGIISKTSVDDYLNNKIKKHENTLFNREKMFKEYLETTGFNADPVLLCYKKNIIVDNLISKILNTRSEYEFTTTDKVSHKLWVINNKSYINTIIKEFKKIENIYIADGHHRCASSALLEKKTNKYFMSLLIDEDQLNIINFNRLVKKPDNISFESVLKKINNTFEIVERENCLPNKQDQLGMYMNQKSYILKPNKNKYNINDPVMKLGPSILLKNILVPILNIKDQKNNKNIEFLSGNIELKKIKEIIDSKEFDIAFMIKPITINEIKDVADQDKYMPAKSTYIEPKIRSGITIYKI